MQDETTKEATTSSPTTDMIKKPDRVVPPARYDRFFAPTRKYNPLIAADVRHAFEDNISELLTVEARCQVYHGAENVRLALLVLASACAIALFYASMDKPFPDNVPAMTMWISAYVGITLFAIFYVYAYLESGSFLTVSVPPSQEVLEGFLDVEGGGVAAAPSCPRLNSEEEAKSVAELLGLNEKETEKYCERATTKFSPHETSVPRLSKYEHHDHGADKTLASLFGNNNTNNGDDDDAKKKKNKKHQQQPFSSPTTTTATYFIAPNLGFQFASHTSIGEEVFHLSAGLVHFRGSWLRPALVREVDVELQIAEFFSDEGLFYPPALRVEMRRIMRQLLTRTSKKD